jgi:hypothetical protein
MRTILAIAMAFLLAAPGIALADKKKNSSSGKDTPTESVGFNYGTLQQSYVQQKMDRTTPRSGVNGGGPTPKGGGIRH